MRKISKHTLSVAMTLSITLLSVLAACSGTLDLAIETTPGAVATISALATENVHLATLVAKRKAEPSTPGHSPKPTPTRQPPPTTPSAEPLPAALVYRIPAGPESEIHVLEPDGVDHRALTLPSHAGYYRVAGRRLAYTLNDVIYLADLIDGTTQALYGVSGRLAPDFDLCWSSDGRVLAYALAYEEADGSRMVELGTLDGDQQEVITVLTARSAGPTPAPSSIPSVSPPAGFANLHLVGFDRAAGRILAVPVGGAESYKAVLAFDTATGQRTVVLAFDEPRAIQEVTASPNLTRLAIHFTPAQIAIYNLTVLQAAPRTYDTSAGVHPGAAHWSPDGQRLAFLLYEGEAPDLAAAPARGLWVLDAIEMQAYEVTKLEGPEATLIGWAPDGGVLLVEWLDALSRGRHHQLMDIATDQVENIALPPGAGVMGWASQVGDTAIPGPLPTSPPLFTPQPTTTPEPAGG